MAGEKEEEVREETEPTEAESEPETETPNPDEELITLIAQAKEQGKLEAQEQYKGIQRAVDKKDKRIAELEKSAPPPVATGVSANKAVIDALEEGDYTKARAAIAQEEQRQTTESQRQVQLQRQATVTREKQEELSDKITTANLDPDDEMFDRVWDAFKYARDVDGDFTDAEKRLNRVLSKQSPKETKDKPEVSTDVQEAARKMLAEKGLLKTETGGPSASAMSWVDFEKAFNESKIPFAVYEERAKREGKI